MTITGDSPIMKTLLEFVELSQQNSLLEEVQLLEKQLTEVMSNAVMFKQSRQQRLQNPENPKSAVSKEQRRISNSNSKVTEFPEEELNHKMGEALKRLEAAYRGLGLTNKLSSIQDKAKNRSRIMSNVHKLRMILRDVEAKLAEENNMTMSEGELVEGEVVDMAAARAKKKEKLEPKEDKAEYVHTKWGAAKADININPFDGVKDRVIKSVKDKLKMKESLENAKAQIDPAKARSAVIKSGGNFLDTRLHKAAKLLKKKMSKEKEVVSEKWDSTYKTPESKKGMFKGKTKADLEADLAKLKKSGPHKEGTSEFTKEKELNFAIRAKSGWEKGK